MSFNCLRKAATEAEKVAYGEKRGANEVGLIVTEAL